MLHHRVYAVMDAAMEFFFGQFQTDFADMERALLWRPAAERKDRPTCGQPDFQRPKQPVRVVLFAFGKEGRIELADFLLQPRYAILLVLLPQALTQVGVGGGDVIETVGKGPDIEAGTTYHDSGGVIAKNISRPLQGQLLENGGIDFLTDRVRIDKIMVNCV